MNGNKLIGGGLMGCGILVAALSGLCVIILVGSSGGEVFRGSLSDLWQSLGVVALFAGIPLLVGLVMVFGGWQLIKSARRSGERDGQEGPDKGDGRGFFD